MWQFLTSAVSGLIGLVVTSTTGYFEHQSAKRQAKRAVELEQITKQADLDVQTLNNHADSWKDEYLVLVITIPLILTFVVALAFPSFLPNVIKAWEILNTVVPSWFSNLFSAVAVTVMGGRMFEKYIFRNR